MTKRNVMCTAIVALAIFASGSMGRAAVVIPVTGWVVHNGPGTSTVSSAGTNTPTFGTADDITAMGKFGLHELLHDGDFVSLTTTLTVGTRTTNTGVNALNTQLRIGLFDGPAGNIGVADFPDKGFIIEYSNLATGGLIREQTSATQTSPFTSPTNIGNGVQDSGGDSIRGANIGNVLFELTLTRNSGKLDITGKISGTDSSNGNPYLSTYSKLGFTTSTFSCNRAGFFFGPQVDGVNGGTLHDVNIMTNVPEQSSWAVAAVVTAAGLGMSWFGKRSSRRECPAKA